MPTEPSGSNWTIPTSYNVDAGFPPSRMHTVAPDDPPEDPFEETLSVTPIEWYTEADRPRAWVVTHGREFTNNDGFTWVFNDPEDVSVQRRLFDFCRYQDPLIPMEYLAWTYGLPSAAAAQYALMQVCERRPESGRGILRQLESMDTPCPDACCYVGPVDPHTDGEHSEWCECDDCVGCGECGEPDCETCWPDGYECGCYDYDCRHCYPDGHPDECDCHRCMDRHNVDDDQDLYDPWTGRPDMPESPPGRCRIGVEVEFNAGSRYEIANAITRNGIACLEQGYTHAVTRFWKMTEDSTVTGGECVSPILSGSDRDIEEIREVIRIIKAHGGSTGRNVGLHVHVDITQFRTMQLKSLAWNLRLGQRFLASFVPEWRYDGTLNHGATLLSDYDWDCIDSWLDNVDPGDRNRTVDNRNSSCPLDRYTAFNFNSVLTYGTVEMRLLGHTLNTIKVRTWIRVLQAIVEASRKKEIVDRGADVLTWLVEHGDLEQEHADQFRSVAITRGNENMLVAA